MQREVDIIVEVCAQLAEQENLQATIIESAKGAGLMGFSALIGGLLGGKNGLLIGGAIGSAAGYFITSDFRSIPQIIREDMTDDQRKKLFRRVKVLLRGISVKDTASVMQFLATNIALKSSVLSVVSDYLKNDMGLSM